MISAAAKTVASRRPTKYTARSARNESTRIGRMPTAFENGPRTDGVASTDVNSPACVMVLTARVYMHG